MALLPTDPMGQMDRFRRSIDHFFSDFPFSMQEADTGVKVDIHETDHQVVAVCDVPGIEKKEDLTINISDHRLTISGTIRRSNEVKEEHIHRQERYTGSFQRSVTLPCAVSEEGVEASYRNGVLEVKMPKLESGMNRRIDVNFE